MLALVGAGNALIDVAGFTLIARLSPANVLARVFGVLESLAALTVGIGGVVTPLVIDALDLRTALVVLGLVTPVAIALTWVRLRALDAGMLRRDEELRLLQGRHPARGAAPAGARDDRSAARPRRRPGR